MSEDSNFTVKESTFDSNSALDGGAIDLQCFNPCTNIIADSTFTNNEAIQNGGAI